MSHLDCDFNAELISQIRFGQVHRQETKQIKHEPNVTQPFRVMGHKDAGTIA